MAGIQSELDTFHKQISKSICLVILKSMCYLLSKLDGEVAFNSKINVGYELFN